jgi:hypothetical protein
MLTPFSEEGIWTSEDMFEEMKELGSTTELLIGAS